QDALKKVQGGPAARSPLGEIGIPHESGRVGRGEWPWRLIGGGVAAITILFLTIKLPGMLLGRTPPAKPLPSVAPRQPTTTEAPPPHEASVPRLPTTSRRVAAAAPAPRAVAEDPGPRRPISPIAATASLPVVEEPEPALAEPESRVRARAVRPPRDGALAPEVHVDSLSAPVTETAREPLVTPVMEGKDRYYFNMGLFYQQQGQYARAFEAYQKTIEFNPFHVEAYNNLGALYKEIGDIDQAVERYRKALSIDPEYVKAYNNLGVALIHRGELEEAAVEFERALQLNPKNVESYTNLGVIYRRRDQVPEAIRAFEAALSVDPDHAETHYNLALLMEGQGRIAEAIKHYRRFVSTAQPAHRSVVARVITRIRHLSRRPADVSATKKFPHQ
ncbi:MAG: tetratricopeptide repeat protein, partial [Candidatus Methylomirabilales bacterium]